jgi:hypothetical protein
VVLILPVREKKSPCVTVIGKDMDGIPLATTSRVLAPVSVWVGTSNSVETGAFPVATPMVL